MSGFCEGYINNCDCRNCQHEHQVRESEQKSFQAHLEKQRATIAPITITRLPLGCSFLCAHCTETSYAYFIIEKPSETVYLCAGHLGAELYRTMKAYKLKTFDSNEPSLLE